MKLSDKQADDLLTLVDHVRRDISYAEGGTFNTGEDCDELDHKSIKKAERAIELIKKIILERE